MSTNYKLRISQNPNFNSVQGLTNRTWDPATVPIVSGRGATEDQLQVVDGKIVELSENVPQCTDDPFTHLRGRVDAMEEVIADCSDDVYAQIKDRVDRIQEAFQDCSDDPWNTINSRLDELEARQTNCCNIPQDEAIALMKAKINECIAAIQGCCDSVTPVVPIP